MMFFAFVGEVGILFGDVVRRFAQRPFEVAETINQMAFIGAASVPIVGLTGFLSGAVMSLYISKFLMEYGGSAYVGATVGLTITRELGPMVAAIMVAARCGSATAAQIGTMAVSEQIDALRMLSVHPTKYLVIPRVLAGVLMLPVLALIAIWFSITGGLLIAMTERVPYATFIQSIQSFVKPSDFVGGLIKAPFFGLIIALVACQQGLHTRGGAVGVGRSTTNTVVISMILIYVANFALAKVLFG